MSRNSAQPELTEEELLAAPAKLLSREQRAKRRRIRNNAAKARTRQRRKRAQDAGIEKRIFCADKKQNGDDCSNYAVIGAEKCWIHLSDEEKEKHGIVRRPRQAGPAALTGPQLARDVMETAVIKVLQPYFLALGLEIMSIDEETGNPVVRDMGPDAGLMLHGESKDGWISMSKYPDLAGRVQIAEKMFDRVYGRPKQTNVIEGGSKPVQVQPVRTVERSQEMARLLGHLGMGQAELPPAPHLPGEALQEAVETTATVVQLRHDEDPPE